MIFLCVVAAVWVAMIGAQTTPAPTSTPLPLQQAQYTALFSVYNALGALGTVSPIGALISDAKQGVKMIRQIAQDQLLT